MTNHTEQQPISYQSFKAEQDFGFSLANTELIAFNPSKGYQLNKILNFIGDIAKSPEGIAFTCKANGLGKITVKAHQPLAGYFRLMAKMLDEYNGGLVYSPEVNLFFQSCVDYQWPHSFSVRPDDRYFDQKLMGEKFNELIAVIKQGLVSPEYKREVGDREWNQQRNHDSAKEYVDALFACTARLVVIRVDLGYPYQEETDTALNTRLAVLQQDMKRFKRRMATDPLFDHMAGYIMKLEYGLMKGHHLHCMLFF